MPTGGGERGKHVDVTELQSQQDRTHKADVLVVGDAPFERAVREALTDGGGAGGAPRTTCVPDYLMALGSLAHRSARVVVGRFEQLNGDLAATGSALRALLPEGRLLLVTDRRSAEMSQLAFEAGFDACIAEPIDPAALRDALHPQAAASDTTQEPTQLGDIDLVEALLDNGTPLRDLALRLVRAESGIASLAWVEDAAEAPRGSVTAAITWRGKAFGWLCADRGVTAEALAAWAGWLSRWLTLEQHIASLRTWAMKDELTGGWNRRYFGRFLETILARAERERFRVTLMVFDIDDFKIYNDRYGHAAGDDILRETARLMQAVVRDQDVVARIGGDEFAVIFWDAEGPRKPNSQHPQDVMKMAQRFQRAICSHRFPKLLDEAPGTLTISGGLASFPWDGRTPDVLLERADSMAIQSKRQGKNIITVGPGAQREWDLNSDRLSRES